MAGSADVGLVFALFAGTIFAGVLAHRAFDRTGIPDVLLLIALGLVVGPLLGLIDPASLGAAVPYIGSFALLIILLEGGLELNYHHVLEKARATTLITLASLALTTLVVAGVAHVAGLGFWPSGVLLGLIVAPLSAAVLIPMLGRLRVQPETRALLSLECSVGEALAVVAVFAATEAALAGSPDLGLLGSQLLATFGLGVVLALVGGLVWLELLRFLGPSPYSYMVTLAAAVALFAGVEAVGGNGYVAVLVFGLVLSNAREISDHLPRFLRTTVKLDETVRWMNTEVTFFVRTFFFVYLGLALTLAAFTAERIGLALALLAGILAARALAVALLTRVKPSERKDAPALLVLVPRGLATAVLAAVPLSLGFAGAALFVEVSSVLIIATNLAMTVGLVVVDRRSAAAARPGADLAAGR